MKYEIAIATALLVLALIVDRVVAEINGPILAANSVLEAVRTARQSPQPVYDENYILYSQGTASDPQLQFQHDGRETYTCFIEEIFNDPSRPGKRMAFIMDSATKKFIVTKVFSDIAFSVAPNLFIRQPSKTDARHFAENYVTYSSPNTSWEIVWLSHPYLPGTWVLGLKER